MKLMGKLKQEVDGTDTKEGKRNIIRKAGMLLTDSELEQVSGGEFVAEPVSSSSDYEITHDQPPFACYSTFRSLEERPARCICCGREINWD